MNGTFRTLAAASTVLLSLTGVVTHRLQTTVQHSQLLEQEKELLARRQEEIARQLAEERELWRVANERIQQEMEGLQDARALKSLYAQSQDKFMTLTREFEKISAEKISLEQANMRLDNRVNSLTREFTANVEQLKQAQQQVLALKDNRALAQQQDKIKQAEKAVSEKEQELSALRQQFKEAQQREQTVSGQQQALDRQLQQVQREKDTTQKKLDALRQRYAQRSRPLRDLQKKVKTLKRDIAAQNAQRAQLEKDLAREQEKSLQVEQRFSQAQEKLAELQQHSRAQLMETKDKLFRYETLKAEHDMLRLQFERTQKRLEEEMETRVRLQQEMLTAQTEVTARQQNASFLQQQLAGLQEEKRRLEQQLAAAPAAMPALVPEDSAAQRQREVELSALRDRNVSLQSLVEELRGQTQSYKNDIARLEQEKRQLHEFKEVIAPDQQRLKNTEDKLSQAYVLYDTAQTQLLSATEALMRKEVEVETAQHKIAALERDLAALRQESAGSGAESIRNVADMRNRVAALNETVREKEAALARTNEDMQRLLTRIKELEQQASGQEQERAMARDLQERLRAQMAQTNDLLQQRESELQTARREIASLRGDISTLRSDVASKKAELDDLTLRQRKTLDDLAQATRVNLSLQENLVTLYEAQTRAAGAPPAAARSAEQERAETLRREVEQLLGK